MGELSDQELETYARQIVLQDIGYEGQLKLRNAKACIIGLGGLGSAIAPKLVGMGIGYLRIVDRDIVSRSDLHRQYLYDANSVGRPKVEVAFQKLGKLNPDVRVDPFPESLNSTNADALIGGVDVILDGLDSPETRYIVNRTCNKFKIPFVFGAAIEAFGNVSTIVPGQTFCLECFMPGIKDEDMPKCAVVGVHPAVLGIVTAVQVSEAVRLIIGQRPKLLNKLLEIDIRELECHTIDMNKLEDCSVCGIKLKGPPEPLIDKFFEETCAKDGRRNFIISPSRRIEINLKQLCKILKEKGFRAVTTSTFGVTFEQPEGGITSILRSGTMIVQTPPGKADNQKEDVLGTYKSLLVDGMGFSKAILPVI